MSDYDLIGSVWLWGDSTIVVVSEARAGELVCPGADCRLLTLHCEDDGEVSFVKLEFSHIEGRFPFLSFERVS